jgi:hypothetical protein
MALGSVASQPAQAGDLRGRPPERSPPSHGSPIKVLDQVVTLGPSLTDDFQASPTARPQ